MGLILLITLSLALVVVWPAWPHAQPWGHKMSGLIGLLLALVIALMVCKVLPFV